MVHTPPGGAYFGKQIFSGTPLGNAPAPLAPFHQQGLEAAAGHASLKINGADVNLIVPPVGMSGVQAAVLAACGVYTR